jgi:hypothetical protein
LGHDVGGALAHEAAKGDDAKAREGLSMAPVVFHQPPPPRRPGARALDGPAFPRRDEALFRFGAFDRAELDAFRARILPIACGYEDADDLDHPRKDPAFKIAFGRLPDTRNDLCAPPTMSRWENAPTLREIVKLGRVMIDLCRASYAAPPKAVTRDIDDACDIVHGHQQLPLFNAHYDERRFLPIHICDTATGRPVAIILRLGKTPTGKEARGHLRRIVRRIRAHWPITRIAIRGDGHYGRHEAMD